MTADPAAELARRCCAAAYSGDAVAMVLGESYHPGGLALTRELLSHLELRAGQRVLDVAAGRGASALLIATEHSVEVDGVDLSPANVDRANTAAHGAGLGSRVRFHLGDAERLPLGDGAVDAAVCECAFCTFPDKPAAAAELARVLRRGGRLGITDVTVAPPGLTGDLAGLAGWVACLADARPLEEYSSILAAAGLRTVHTERHDAALARMVEEIDARLRALRMVRAAVPAIEGIDVDRALDLCAQAAAAVRDGVAGYAMLVAVRE
ncbi:MAG TPA: methyltransferase domain-containing protein [Candidatus Dormibacteraeota bacterium]|nr:methyltransferase domain-containing protein [Candidatus Dormibacteraeota bacterium]